MTEEGEEANVQDQLDSVLSNLYDFGDDFESTSMTVSEEEQQNGGTAPDNEIKEMVDSNGHQLPNVDLPISKRDKKNPSFFFNAIKDELLSQSKGKDVPISTGSKAQIEVVRFVSRKARKQAKRSDVQDRDSLINFDSKEKETNQEFDLEKARLEVHKFGITGYKKEKQRKFEQERAIMLGAKPPKREYVNYKVYQEKIKEREQAKKEKSLTETVMEPVKKKPKQGQKIRKPRKAKGSSGFVPDGQVGRFRDGALILSSKDIHKIKQSKISK